MSLTDEPIEGFEISTEADAIASLARQAVSAVAVHCVGGDARAAFAVLPAGHSLKSLAHLQAGPDRIVADRSFRDVKSLGEYLERFELPASIGFADWKAKLIRVNVDYHHPDNPSHNRHSATFRADWSTDWSKWRKVHDKPMNQVQFGRFLEERAHNIAKPDPASMIDLAMNFEVNRSMKFKSTLRLKNGLRELRFVEEDETKGAMQTPDLIELLLPVFDGMEPDRIIARFRYRIDEGRLVMFVSFDNLDDIERTAFERCVAALNVERPKLLILNSHVSGDFAAADD